MLMSYDPSAYQLLLNCFSSLLKPDPVVQKVRRFPFLSNKYFFNIN